jgi:hypothetical protein
LILKLKDVTVISLELTPGIKTPKVKAMVSLDFEGVNRSQIAHIDLEPSESHAVVDMARQIEERLLAQETNSPGKIEVTTNIIAIEKMTNSMIQQASPEARQTSSTGKHEEE